MGADVAGSGATKRGKNGARGGEGKVVPGRSGRVALFQNERGAEEFTMQ